MSTGLRTRISPVLMGLLALHLCPNPACAQTQNFDIVIYGGTSGGIAAAVEAARLGKTVALVEPTGRLGGMTTNGLGATDSGNGNAIQGLARQFYSDVSAISGGSFSFNLEPNAGLSVFNDWVRTPGITLFTNQRLDLAGGVTKSGSAIQSIRMESGLMLAGSMFIDAGYEGDLMARAGVSWHAGRESNATYGERYNGVQVSQATKHQFSTANPVSAYVDPGNAASGLLPGINPAPPAADGSADNALQAYNFRLTLTKAADRIAWSAPAGYNRADYELVRRHIAANNLTGIGSLLSIRATRNGKYDMNNNGAVSTDFIGRNYDYANANHAGREAIVAAHRKWQQGLIYYLSSDLAVPQSIRDELNAYGLARDEFTGNGGWSEQLYVREARRMIGQYVMTDKNVLGTTTVTDSIGLGSYTMDSHNVQRYADAAGNVRNEGDVQVGVPAPYRISYRSLTPTADQASNLLVTSALSASHIAYGSIRMEPVFMITGQAGGAAAALAIEQGTTVQGLNYSLLRQRLIAGGALLEWPGNLGVPFTAKADFNDLATLPASLRYTAGGSGMNGNWDGTNTESIVAGDLSYTRGGYAVAQSGSPAGKVQGSYNAPRQNYRDLSAAMTGDIWFSILLNNPDSGARAGFSFNPATNADPAQGPVERLLLLNGQTLEFQVAGVTIATLSTPLPLGQTHLLLGRLTADSGNDRLAIWADPADLSNLGLADLLIEDQNLLDVLTRVGLYSYDASTLDGTATTGGYLDVLRISNAPDGYFVATGVPEPGAVALLLSAALVLCLRRRRGSNSSD